MRAAATRNVSGLRSPRALQRLALHQLSDGQLLLQHAAGDPQAFAALVDRYQPRLLRFIYRTIGDWGRAEDLVQEVFIRTFRHGHGFDQTKKFSTWIYTIAANLAKHELRLRSRNPLFMRQTATQRRPDDRQPLQIEDTSARPDDLYHRHYLKEVIKQCVGQLPAHQRTVLVLREFEGMSYTEIAEITACNLGTVKSRLSRARENAARIISPLLE